MNETEALRWVETIRIKELVTLTLDVTWCASTETISSGKFTRLVDAIYDLRQKIQPDWESPS